MVSQAAKDHSHICCVFSTGSRTDTLIEVTVFQLEPRAAGGRSHRPNKKEPETLRVEKRDLGFSSLLSNMHKFHVYNYGKMWKKKNVTQVLTSKGILKVISAMYTQIFFIPEHYFRC